MGLVLATFATSCSTSRIKNEEGEYVTDGNGKYVSVQKDSRSIIASVFPALSVEIDKYLDRKLSAYRDGDLFEFPDDGEFQILLKAACATSKVADSCITEDVRKGLLFLARDRFNTQRLRVIYPKLVDRIFKEAKSGVETCLAGKKYAEAREILWTAPTRSGIPEVDNPVRELCAQCMNSMVNPPEWAALENEMRAQTAAYLKKGAFDEGMAWLKSVPHVRTYSERLDGKLLSVRDELVKIGVDGKDLESAVEATKDLAMAAEYLYDLTDRTDTSVEKIEKSGGYAPDLKSYEQRIQEYREMLIRFNCTTSNADRVVAKFKEGAEPFLRPLYKGPVVDQITKEFLFLGPGALNLRIDGLRDELGKELFDAKVASEANVLGEKVKGLVAAKKFAEARETVWGSYSTGRADMDVAMRPIAIRLMRETINSAHWKQIQSEVSEKRDALFAKDDYDAFLVWMADYPLVRGYTIGFDEAAKIATEKLVRLGIPQDKVSAAAEASLRMAVEVDRLVDLTDTTIAATPNAKKELPKELDEILARYRSELIRLDCSAEGADRAVQQVREAVVPYLDGSLEPEGEPVLLLGTAALNNRIEALREQELFAAKSQKYQWIFDELNNHVRNFVDAGKFAEARTYIRDISLVGDPEWDARIYAARVGLLNGLVNPAMYKALSADLDSKVSAFLEKKDYEGLVAYADAYPFVHDDYQRIMDGLEATKTAMSGLKIGKESAESYIDELRARIDKVLDSRSSSYAIPERKLDLDPLEKSLAELEKAVYAQHCGTSSSALPGAKKSFWAKAKTTIGSRDVPSAKELESEILVLMNGVDASMTTWELNRKLEEKLQNSMMGLDALVASRDAERALHAYEDLLASLDAEVSYDSQIAMAEDAISKQACVAGLSADLQAGALLGEYARVMRLLKKGNQLSPDEATAILLGSVFLGQPAVFDAALKLKANADGISTRDPLRRNAVLLAIQTGHNEFLSKLVSAGASFTVVDAIGNTAVHYAVQRGNIAVLKAMLAKNDVDKVNLAGESALFMAVRKNQAAIAAVLTEAKANANARNGKSQSVFDVACICGSRDVLDVLAKAGASYGPEQLSLAARSNRLAVVQWLVANGVDVNADGVMESAACGSDIKAYLVGEGGLVAPCDCPVCKPVPEAPAAEKPEEVPLEKETKDELRVSEASGEIRFVVKEK